LLVLGGSQGARIFAEIVPPAVALLPAAWRARLRLSQQARPEDRDGVAAALAALAASGRPAVLVPYPHAADDHQSANAAAFAATGGGWVVPQLGLTAAGL